MARQLAGVTDDALPFYCQLTQGLVESQARSRTLFSIYNPDSWSQQIGKSSNIERVARGHGKTQLPAGEIHHHQGLATNRIANPRYIVFPALGVAQMNAGNVDATVSQNGKRFAAGTAQGNRSYRDPAPREPIG